MTADADGPSTAPPAAAADPEALARAEAAKDAANASFKARRYHEAVAGYSAAIAAHPGSAVYFSNRAFAHIKLEEYGSAIADATRAIELDAAYVKAYYRRCGALRRSSARACRPSFRGEQAGSPLPLPAVCLAAGGAMPARHEPDALPRRATTLIPPQRRRQLRDGQVQGGRARPADGGQGAFAAASQLSLIHI